jgi:hypothetical protein
LAVVTFGLLLSTSVLLASIVAARSPRAHAAIAPAAVAADPARRVSPFSVGNALTWCLLIELVRPAAASCEFGALADSCQRPNPSRPSSGSDW